MNISRFFGATNREALRQVRLALGPDALIVSNKRVSGGVEILATDQTSVPADQAEPPKTTPVSQPVENQADIQIDNDILNVIGDLKGSLESRIDELVWGNQLRNSNYAISLFQDLLRCGFSTALLRAMLKSMPEQTNARSALNWARAQLTKHLPMLTSEDSLWQPGLALALVGPTGVGKTTTVAKLAARCVRRIGPENLVLITTDTYRIGAHEQLKIYGQMLRVTVHVVQDIHALRRVMQEIRPDQTILIDNVGISQRDKYVADQAALLAGAGRRVERLLVLNAASHGDTLDEVAKSYANDGGTPLRGCIISKIDEATRLGAALDTAIRYKLPIHYVSNGQKVPENLLFLTAQDLVNRTLIPSKSDRTLYAPTQSDLSALMSLAQPDQSQENLAQKRRQEQLLPRILSQNISGDSLSINDLKSAVSQLDNDIVMAESYDLWHTRSSTGLPNIQESIDHLNNLALDQGCNKYIISHNKLNLNHNNIKYTWLSSACFSDAGNPIAALDQQIGLVDGWYTPAGAQANTPVFAQALINQVQTVNSALKNNCLHVFDNSSQTTLRSLSVIYEWLALATAGTKVYLNDESYTLSAACQNFNLQPVNGYQLSGLLKSGKTLSENISWWAGTGVVQLKTRGLDTFTTNALYVRAVDSTSGAVLRSWYAFVNSQLTPETLALALVLRQEYQTAMRAGAQALLQAQEREFILDRSIYAAQSILAAWHLVSAPGLGIAREVTTNMLGLKDLKLNNAYPALLKLFNLKDLLA